MEKLNQWETHFCDSVFLLKNKKNDRDHIRNVII